MFRNIKGQDHALQILSMAMDNERVAQAYLFHGMDGVGKFTTALYFGMALNCLSKSEFRPCGVCASCRRFLAFDHPDFIYLFPTPNFDYSAEGELKKEEDQKQYDAYLRNKMETPWQDFFFTSSIEIRKEAIGMLIKRLDLSSYEAKYRICIIEDADQMNIPTANAFLKTLEEPPVQTVIILVTSRLSMLLPTIVSRCQPVYFKPVAPAVIEGILKDQFTPDLNLARTASRIANGSVTRGVRMLQENASLIRAKAFELVQLAAGDRQLAFYNMLYGDGERLNAEFVIELIKHINMFVGDLNLIASQPEQITNVDKREFLTAVCPGDDYLSDRVVEFLLQAEDLTRKIRGKVNLNLILTNLFFALIRVFKAD